MGTTEKPAADLYTVPDDFAVAVFANRCDGLNRALEAVERVVCAG
jgi:hypothetical protein